MTTFDIARTDPPQDSDEVTTLRTFVDYFRNTLRLKAGGLDRADLARTLPPSELTLAGLVKHLAGVEDYWFGEVLRSEPEDEPWASADWDTDGDWDFTSATQDEPADLWALYEASVARSEARLAAAVQDGGTDPLTQTVGGRRGPISLRWILVHMIEEYARHCGHADLIRQSIDGATGD